MTNDFAGESEMKLVGQVRSVERALGNSNQDAAKGITEKRHFKIDVKPASKASAYYGYGSMQFILHGRELEESGLDLGTKIEMYLVPEGGHLPDCAAFDDAKRELHRRLLHVVRHRAPPMGLRPEQRSSGAVALR